MESRIKDWGLRLDICTTQLKLAIEAKQPASIEEWLSEGFEALEHCHYIIDVNAKDPKDIELIKTRINHFKVICKEND